MSIQVFLDLIPEFARYDESAICRIECSAKELRAMGAEVQELRKAVTEKHTQPMSASELANRVEHGEEWRLKESAQAIEKRTQ